MSVLSKISMALVVLATVGFGSSHPVAAQVTFQGSDPGVGPGGARPVSDAASASFNTAAAALGTTRTITFESAPLGAVTSLVLDSNTTLTTLNQDAAYAGISNDQTANLGYNTTAGGSKYLRFAQTFNTAGSATFTFLTPVDAFGSYLTGTESNVGAPVILQFSDGSSKALTVPRNPAGGGVQFFGFTDAGKSISAITFAQAVSTDGTRDLFGIDDITYAVPAVPEASTTVSFGLLLALGLGGLALRSRKAKASGAA